MTVLSDSTRDEARRHILVVCHAWYGDTIGGSFRLATDFAEYLASTGHQVSYICCAPSRDGATEYERINDVDVFRYLPAGRRLSGIGRLRYHVSATKKLVRCIQRKHPIQVLSGHSPLQALGAATVLSGAFKNYTVHSPFDDELLSNAGRDRREFLHRLARRVARWVDFRNVALANRVQTLSKYTLNVFQGKHESALQNKGIVAPGWVEADRFQPAKDRQALRGSLGYQWETDKPLFFTLRRLENRMGLDTLIDACSILSSQGLEFRTLIGGSGSLKQDLQKRIDDAGLVDHVQLLGRLPEEHLALAYAAADCFVLPTRALECFGLIVLEAFACNTPVIASAAAAIPELAGQQGVDWMFEPGNVSQLASRMENFITDKLDVTVNLRDIALQYDRPKVLKRWENLIQSDAPASAGVKVSI